MIRGVIAVVIVWIKRGGLTEGKGTKTETKEKESAKIKQLRSIEVHANYDTIFTTIIFD